MTSIKHSMAAAKDRPKMVILTSYASGASYGLLGPQMAATIIRDTTPYECIVIGVAREDDPKRLLEVLGGHFGSQRPVIGFSLLSGGSILVSLAGVLKQDGATTLLAGPQAETDFRGEPGQIKHPHRFKGHSNQFSFALQGPAEQIRPFLTNIDARVGKRLPGFVCRKDGGRIDSVSMQRWDQNFLGHVDWNTLFRLDGASLKALAPSSAQVLQQIGCPHAKRSLTVDIDYPTALAAPGTRSIRTKTAGCSFCDVAIDKGFQGALDVESVLSQIRCLPQTAGQRKIPFELINENPLPGLPHLLRATAEARLMLSEIHLTLRADWLLRGKSHLRAALRKAREFGLRIVLSSVGFESFDNRILRNLNKGISVDTNLAAVDLMRQLKNDYPDEFGYLRHEGGNHGFIHPTPWDTPESEARVQNVIAANNLAADILPNHSTPLIIHHASALGDWIRAVEGETGLSYPRQNSWVSWWDQPV